jgi:soluble epoxide hydrolase/lipid-phosphate phosphatase
MANYHPEFLSRLVFIVCSSPSLIPSSDYSLSSLSQTDFCFQDIGYSVPGGNLTLQNIKQINSMIKANNGYEIFGYFIFFNEEDAPKILDAHVRAIDFEGCYSIMLTGMKSESMRSLMFTTDADIGKKYMGAEGGTRIWLEAGKVAPAVSYFSPEVSSFRQHALYIGLMDVG